MRNERRHARWLGAAARRYGASVPEVEVIAAPESLVEIAVNNAVEGCVREAWAALAAMHRAEHASDPVLRAVFARIARDEAGHAQLAWDLHGKFLEQLDPAGQEQVRGALAQALADLPGLARAQGQWPAALGQPGPAAAQLLADRLAEGLAA